MKAEILIFSFDMLSGIGLGQAEFTPVETSVTRLSHGLYRNGLIRRDLRCGCARDRVWPLKQEALTLQGRVVHTRSRLLHDICNQILFLRLPGISVAIYIIL